METLVAVLALIQFFVVWRVLVTIKDDIHKIRLAAQFFAEEKLQASGAGPQAPRQAAGGEPEFSFSSAQAETPAKS